MIKVRQEKMDGLRRRGQSTRLSIGTTTTNKISLLFALILALVISLVQQPLVESFALENQSKNLGPKVVIMPDSPTFHIDIDKPSERALSCLTTGDHPELFTEIHWVGPNKLDNWDELSKRHQVAEAENLLQLRFKNPTLDDKGVYYCIGTYQGNDKFNASVEVSIDTPIKLEPCPERQYLVQGTTNSKITCRISADTPRVQFKKDKKKLGQRYKWDNEDGLVINGEVDRSDAGIYEVQVTSLSSGQDVRREIHVEIHAKPEIETTMGSSVEDELYSIEGQPKKLECKVSGNPQPLVYWLDPKLRNLTSVGGYIVSPETGTLQISKVNKVDDQGPFTCRAVNTAGEATRKFYLKVDSPPEIKAFDNATADEGSKVTYECRATGDPRPTFSVRRQGNNQAPYRYGDNVVSDVNVAAEDGGSNVYVQRLTMTVNRAHFGKHYCNATNRAGSAEKEGFLFVNYKPDLSLTPPEQFVRIGKSMTVTCHIKAYPAPEVEWFIDNTQAVNLQSFTSTSPDGQTHIVTMQPPSSAHGKITCRARNKMGFSEAHIIPRYTTIPGPVEAQIIERTPTTVKIQLFAPNDGGERIKSFKYSVDGRTLDTDNPYFTYRGDKKDGTIDASISTSTYTIRNLLPYYTYKFSVRAVNNVGEGDVSEMNVDTPKATKPDPPIIKATTPSSARSTSEIPSEYSNGYVLKWSPPELDNGDPVLKYLIRFSRHAPDSLGIPSDVGESRVVEQTSERPLLARLGPLDSDRSYKIEIFALNKLGTSDPAQITIYTQKDRPPMPDFEAQSWIPELTLTTVCGILIIAIILLIFLDLFCCLRCHLGMLYYLRNACCPKKGKSVESEGYSRHQLTA